MGCTVWPSFGLLFYTIFGCWKKKSKRREREKERDRNKQRWQKHKDTYRIFNIAYNTWCGLCCVTYKRACLHSPKNAYFNAILVKINSVKMIPQKTLKCGYRANFTEIRPPGAKKKVEGFIPKWMILCFVKILNFKWLEI